MAHTPEAVGGWRKLLQRFHFQGIPWPGSVIYDAFSRSRLFQNQYRLIVDDVAAQMREGLVLDIGTGPARFPLLLCEKLPEVRVEGVDISQAMVAQAQRNVARAGLSGRISIRQAGAASLPYDDESFDVVLSTGSLHHWKNAAECLNEVYRVLKPGRPALMYDLVRKVPPEVVAQLRREYGRFRITLLGLHSFEEPFYSSEELESLAAGSRFGKGETRFVGALCCLKMIKPAK